MSVYRCAPLTTLRPRPSYPPRTLFPPSLSSARANLCAHAIPCMHAYVSNGKNVCACNPLHACICISRQKCARCPNALHPHSPQGHALDRCSPWQCAHTDAAPLDSLVQQRSPSTLVACFSQTAGFRI